MIPRVTASVPLLLGALAHNAYAAPGACEGVCNIHDPGLTQRDDGTYFRFSTGGALAIASAPSLEGPWTDAGTVLPEGSADTWVRKKRRTFLSNSDDRTSSFLEHLS